MNAQHTPTVTREDRICAKGIRESLSAATGDMLAARHREQSQAELLEALERLVEAYREEADPYSIGGFCRDLDDDSAMKDALAAIAKAKGVQS